MSWFDQGKFAQRRREAGAIWGRPVRVFDSISSTNDEALKSIASDALTGIVWIAREQTRGRGRRGNHWIAPAGECLMLSTLLRHGGPPEKMLGLSLIVGLAVRDVVDSLLKPREQRTISVKWPNDLLVEGKKIAGILIETRFDRAGQLGVVIGLGLNVDTAAFPPELKNATSLKLLGVSEERREKEQLVALFLRALEKKVSLFLTRGVERFAAELNHHDALHGRRIRVGRMTGTGSGIDAKGRLQLTTDEGEKVFLDSGHVEYVD